MTAIADNIERIRTTIDEAAREAGRDPAAITLVAVSKKQPAAAIRAAHAAGLRDFGESYLQEALAKREALAALDARWHFIGPIQSNKTRAIAERFDWVHSVDRFKIARRLAEQRPGHRPALSVCLQVNLDGEASKSGLAPEELPGAMERVAGLEGIRVRGLMAIPRPRRDFAAQRTAFARLRGLQEDLVARGHALDALSMGMSGDYRAAVLEGATHLRIGSALFGARK